MLFEPPYRLETVRAVRGYFRGSRRKEVAGLLALARGHPLVKPPLLGRLPERFEVEILDVRREHRCLLRPADGVVDLKAVVDFAGGRRRRLLELLGEPAAPDRAALNEALVREGRRVAGAPGRGACLPEEASASRRLDGLRNVVDLRDLLGESMRRWLNTRDRAAGAFLERALSVPLLYDRVSGRLDHDQVDRLRALPDRSTRLIDVLHDLYGDRLTSAADAIYRPAVHAFVRAACRRVLCLDAPANFRRGAVALIESIHRGENALAVRARLARLCAVHRSHIDEKSLQRLGAVLENLLEKLAAFESFFDATFGRERIAAYHRAFCRDSRAEEIVVETVLGRKVLTLFPCKDYHDYLKGRYSRDCSGAARLAERHLRNPRFFNLRVFLSGAWAGNIYMLDYTEASHAVVLDRVQIPSSADLMPVDFFPPLMAALEANVTGPAGLALLGPSVVSSFAPIQRSYLRHCCGRRTAPISPPAEDFAFESVREASGRLRVLNDPGRRARPAPASRMAESAAP